MARQKPEVYTTPFRQVSFEEHLAEVEKLARNEEIELLRQKRENEKPCH